MIVTQELLASKPLMKILSAAPDRSEYSVIISAKTCSQPRANASLMFLPDGIWTGITGYQTAADWSLNILAQWQAVPGSPIRNT